MALPIAVLIAVLTMNVSDPDARLRDVIEDMDFIIEVKQAYPDNALIQGIFEDTEISLSILRLSSAPDKERVLRELRLYIEQTSALLGIDNEAREFRAFLVALVKKLAQDVGNGMFGDDPIRVKAQSEYLRLLEQQFSLVPSNPIDSTIL